MKFLLKAALFIAAAKFLVATPEGSNAEVDKVGKTTVRDIARQVDAGFTTLEVTLKKLLS